MYCGECENSDTLCDSFLSLVLLHLPLFFLLLSFVPVFLFNASSLKTKFHGGCMPSLQGMSVHQGTEVQEEIILLLGHENAG